MSVPLSLDPQRLMGERFMLLKTLGRGSFGEALLVVDKTTRKHMVVKRLFAKKADRHNDFEECLSEIRNIQSIQHINIVRFHMAWIEAADRTLHMLFEYCDGGDLEQYLRSAFPLPESLVIQFTAQLLMALDHLHVKHVIHRDIKLQNVLLCRSPMVVKLADFGLSKELTCTDAAANTCLGTPLYFSPEIAAMKEYTRKTDIWSLGVMLYLLLTNQFPFHGRTMSEALERIKHHQPAPIGSISPQYSSELVQLVSRMLTKSRSQRPTARELLASPIFREPLKKWPWHPQWCGCRAVFVCRDNCLVNIRAQPTTQSDVVGVLSYGDLAIVHKELVFPPDSSVGWWQLVYPGAPLPHGSPAPDTETGATTTVTGFCISSQFGKSLFQGIDDVARASPFPRVSSPVGAKVEVRGDVAGGRRSSPITMARSPTPPRGAPPAAAVARPTPSPIRRAISPVKAAPAPVPVVGNSPLGHRLLPLPSPAPAERAALPQQACRAAVSPLLKRPSPAAVIETPSPIRRASPVRGAIAGPTSPFRRGGG